VFLPSDEERLSCTHTGRTEHRVQIIKCGGPLTQTASALTSTTLEYPASLPGYQIARSQPARNKLGVRVTCAYGTKMARFLSSLSGWSTPRLIRLRQTTRADTPIMGRRRCISSEQRDSTVWTWEQIVPVASKAWFLTPAVRNREQQSTLPNVEETGRIEQRRDADLHHAVWNPAARSPQLTPPA
jgi:hypothetical protein